MKILARATNWLGDAVMSLPALRVLRSRYPDAHIAVLAVPSLVDFYAGEQSINRVISLDAASGFRDFAAKWQQTRELRREHYDLAVLLPNSFESAALTWLSGARRRVGYARDARGALLTDAIPIPLPGEIPRHQRYYYPELLRRAGIIEALPVIDEILLDGREEARQRGETLFGKRGIASPVIGVNPGAAYGGAKRWLPEYFAEAARKLAEQHGGAIAVFGAAADREICEEVARMAGGVNIAGSATLREFIDMTAACRVCLTNDSGAMHIAAALGVPGVTVFGPTDEIATGPTGASARVVREPVECSPCLLRECPIDHRCMTRVTAERVVEIAREIPEGGERHIPIN